MQYVVEGQVIAEVLLGEGIEGSVVGLELLDTSLRCVKVEVGGGDDGGDDEDTTHEGKETHVEILQKDQIFCLFHGSK